MVLRSSVATMVTLSAASGPALPAVMAYGARLALFRRGLRVPEDVSIIGFDDQAPTAYMIPPLTSIRRTPLEVGEAAGRALIDLMQGKNIVLPEFHSTLMIRESVSRRL